MINVHCNDSYQVEREYIIDILLNDILGLDYKIIYESRKDICLVGEGKKLFIDDSFFQQNQEKYFMMESLPVQPLSVWQVQDIALAGVFSENNLPVIYGYRFQNNEFLSMAKNEIHIGVDIFGSAFFMLTRYEEVVKKERDEYGRFSAKNSLAFQEGFLERPIINEYIELLWWCIKKLWPTLQRKDRCFRIIPTHDVDRPSVFLNFRGFPHFRRLVGDIVVRKNLSLFFRRANIALKLLCKGFKAEWKYTFDYIMDISEAHGLKSTFFFMTPIDINEYDGDYEINNKDVVALVKHISEKGHNIGLHPVFDSFQKSLLIEDNVKKLQDVLLQNGISVKRFGARQHYLRWQAPDTWQYYEDAGIEYDTTLSYADHIGFRCGVCYDFPVFNLKTGEMLKLREYPLIVMEGSGLEYMGLSLQEMECRAIRLKKLCEKYKGDFVLLWHNDRFIDTKLSDLYIRILKS